MIGAGNTGADQDHPADLAGLIEIQVSVYNTAPAARTIFLQVDPFSFVPPEKIQHRIAFRLAFGRIITGRQVNIKGAVVPQCNAAKSYFVNTGVDLDKGLLQAESNQ